jgi:hypothetical protein
MLLRAGSLLSLALAASLAAGAAMGQDKGQGARPAQPVVIELFTSQGCSSCPPADSLLNEMIRSNPKLIALTLPVDYWDYIGWKDTFAQPGFTARQKAYGAMRGDHQIYTPQAVVNGVSPVVGSDRDEIEAASRTAYGKDGALSVPLAAHPNDNGLSVDLGAAPQGAPRAGTFWLFQIARERTVAIGRGENSGHRVTYANVVRHMRRIGDWTGQPTHFDIPGQDLTSPDSDSFALVLQAGSESRPGPILAAITGDQIR